MKIRIKSALSTHPTAQEVSDILLKNRLGDTFPLEVAREFLSPPHPTALSLKNFGFEQTYIDHAMECIWQFHPKHPTNKTPDRPIVVYTDYDADGITGGAILWETLHTLGFKAFPYTPNRITEGYGFSTQGLDIVKEKYNPALIISVDHGIVADAQVTYAADKLGIPIIITDHHHRLEEKVPKQAKAIFHIPALSGSGTAYYVAKEIADSPQYRVQSTESNDSAPSTENLKHMFETEYVGIAAIGTIADLVPLQGPSRSIAYHGLRALTDTKRPGLYALKKVSDHIGKTVTTYEVGFLLAPRINASGRLEDALDALRLLCTKDAVKARALAEKLNTLNVQRQDMVKEAVEEALKIVESQKDTVGNLPKIFIIHQSDDRTNLQPTFWHEGIIGLIASKICEKYHRPTIVLTSADDHADSSEPYNLTNFKPSTYKASCRSIHGFHMTEYLTVHEELLLKYGGHEAAAGFSIESKHLQEFVTKSQEYANNHITDEMLERTITVDCELPLGFANLEFTEKLEKMAPFGMGNPKPVFVSKGKIINVQTMGKEQKHARFRLIQGTEGLDFVAFGKAEELTSHEGTEDASIVFTLDINRWNGSERVQGKFVSFVNLSTSP